MADDGPTSVPLLPTAPERPITTAEEDKLERSGFVRRLADAVVSRTTSKATGVVVGVTGPWGSGKSSVLNLLANQISEASPGAIVVRFDPWLISGRNDLISEFIAELVAELHQKSSLKEKFKGVIGKLVDYGNAISPIATLVPYGSVAKEALKLAKDHLDRKKSLNEQRRELTEALAEIDTPIVVLVDELDRVEDAEIRVVAQLVRSVADFPGVSYVLAYDAERVMRALAGNEKLERGRAYLEKIVQLQIPLPVLIDNEIYRLVEADLDVLADEKLIPTNREAIERYLELRRLLVPQLISTPRDVKRLTGTFGILLRMVAGEVDWIDLLGFCALCVKAPLTTEQIKRNPDAVADDPTSVDEIIARASGEKASREDLLNRVNPEQEGGPQVRRLLAFLFSRLSDDPATRRYNRPQGISIAKFRPLLTALRLDLVPGFFNRDSILNVFRHSASEVTAFLQEAYASDRIGNFIAKIHDMPEDLSALDQQEFWLGVADFLRKPDDRYLEAFSPMHELVMEFAATFFKITDRNARDLFYKLLTQNEIELTSSIVRSHIFHFGLFDHNASHRDGMFLAKGLVEQIVKEESRRYRDLHLSTRFLWGLWDLIPVFTMADVGAWDEPCRARLLEFLSDDPKAVDALTLMFFGGQYSVGRASIAKYLDLDSYLALVDDRLAAGEMHESVRLALEKAKEGMFG